MKPRIKMNEGQDWEQKCRAARNALHRQEATVYAAFKIATEWFNEEGFESVDGVEGQSKDVYAITKAQMIQAYATNLIRCHLESRPTLGLRSGFDGIQNWLDEQHGYRDGE